MIVTKQTINSRLGEPNFRFLCSDLHLGSSCSDHDAIVTDFEKAKACNARILINGDCFDSISAVDRRYDVVCLHPSIAREKDMAAAVVRMAKELLWPYRKLIEIIGIGNHEESFIKFSSNDPVRRLIEELNVDGCKIKHGSFWGYWHTTFIVEGHKKRPKHKLLYMHGAGGDSPVTKGTIDFNRKGRNWTFDALTTGHRHNIFGAVESIADMTDHGKFIERRQLCLATGSYYKNYRQLSDAEVLNQNYAARSTHPPKPIGGLFLILRPQLDANGELEIRQDFATDIVSPRKKRVKPKASFEPFETEHVVEMTGRDPKTRTKRIV